MGLQELLKDIIQSGPSNIKRALLVAERLPTDETLKSFSKTLDNLIPHIPELEKILGDGNMKSMERLLKQVPDAKTLDRLSKALPVLERVPDKETLNKLLDKAESLRGFLDKLEGG